MRFFGYVLLFLACLAGTLRAHANASELGAEQRMERSERAERWRGLLVDEPPRYRRPDGFTTWLGFDSGADLSVEEERGLLWVLRDDPAIAERVRLGMADLQRRQEPTWQEGQRILAATAPDLPLDPQQYAGGSTERLRNFRATHVRPISDIEAERMAQGNLRTRYGNTLDFARDPDARRLLQREKQRMLLSAESPRRGAAWNETIFARWRRDELNRVREARALAYRSMLANVAAVAPSAVLVGEAANPVELRRNLGLRVAEAAEEAGTSWVNPTHAKPISAADLNGSPLTLRETSWDRVVKISKYFPVGSPRFHAAEATVRIGGRDMPVILSREYSVNSEPTFRHLDSPYSWQQWIALAPDKELAMQHMAASRAALNLYSELTTWEEILRLTDYRADQSQVLQHLQRAVRSRITPAEKFFEKNVDTLLALHHGRWISSLAAFQHEARMRHPRYWESRERAARNAPVMNPGRLNGGRGSANGSGGLGAVGSQPSAVGLQNLDENTGNATEQHIDLFHRRGGPGGSLYFELGQEPARASEPVSLQQRWFQRAANPDFLVSSVTPVSAEKGFLPIPHTPGQQIASLRLNASDGRELREGKDFVLYQDPERRTLYAKLPDGQYEMQVGYVAERGATSMPTVRIEADRFLALNNDLERAGLANLAKVLRALPASPTLEEVEQAFQRSGYYSFRKEPNLPAVRQAALGPFASYARFVNGQGIACYQCSGSNDLFRDYLRRATEGQPNLGVRTVNGFTLGEGEVATQFHRYVAAQMPGRIPQILDATPVLHEPLAELATPNPARRAEQFLDDLGRSRERIGRAAEEARLRVVSPDDPWAASGDVSRALGGYLRGNDTLPETRALLARIDPTMAVGQSHEDLMQSVARWAEGRLDGLQRASVLAEQSGGEARGAAGYMQGQLVYATQERLKVLTRAAQVNAESLEAYRQEYRQANASCATAFGRLGVP